jgi:hypothetical protein
MFCCRRVARLAPAPANFSPSSRSGSLVRARNGVAAAKPRNWRAPLTSTQAAIVYSYRCRFKLLLCTALASHPVVCRSQPF